jgi:hypothetical protein
MNKPRIIDEGEYYGVWVWLLPNGHFFQDGQGNYLCMNGTRDDLRCMKLMSEAATHHGEPVGRAIFLPGRRQRTQSEWEDQMEAFHDGKDIDNMFKD